VSLEAGHIVMPGALHASVPVAGTSRFEARFSGIGSVAIAFGAGSTTRDAP
jgi:2-keto-4-pentenoate hydratase